MLGRHGILTCVVSRDSQTSLDCCSTQTDVRIASRVTAQPQKGGCVGLLGCQNRWRGCRADADVSAGLIQEKVFVASFVIDAQEIVDYVVVYEAHTVGTVLGWVCRVIKSDLS